MSFPRSDAIEIAISASVVTIEDWQFALKDPLSPIGKAFYNLLMQKELNRADLEKFLEKQALNTYLKQTKAKQQLLRDIESHERYVREHAKLLKSWVDAQTTVVSKEEASQSTKSLMTEMMNLMFKMNELTLAYKELSSKQSALTADWNKSHQASAEAIIEKINNVMPLVSEERLAGLTDEQKEKLIDAAKSELTQALIPSAPEVAFKINPYLANKVLKSEEDNNSVCINMTKLNDVAAELRVLAILSQLTGPALLAYVKENKSKVAANNISFIASDSDHIKRAVIIQESAQIICQQNAIEVQIKQVAIEIKEKVKAVQDNIHIEELSDDVELTNSNSFRP